MPSQFSRIKEAIRQTLVPWVDIKQLGLLLSWLAALSLSLLQPLSCPADEPKIKPIIGPHKIDLGDKLAVIEMPAGYAFIKKEDAQAILKAEGNEPQGVLGILVPASDKSEENSFFVVCRFEDIGHVRDDDAGKLNADEILNSYKDGSKEQNEERKQLGIPPIFVGGWAEKPHYEKAKHQVVWAVEVKDQDSPSSPVTAVNYNTRILGREGVLSLNLVTDADKLQPNKKEVGKLLNLTSFLSGKSYGDFQPGKDKDAGFGLAGLILGGGAMAAAAKLGIFGGLWKFMLGILLVAKKFIIIAIAGAGALLAKFFGKKKGGNV